MSVLKIAKRDLKKYKEKHKDDFYGIAYKNNQHFLVFNNASTNVRWYEIIGNIYDNPELLEAKNEN